VSVPRFSSRLPFDSPHNELTRALAQRRARGAPVADLTESNPTRVGLAADPDALAAALASARGAEAYDPDPRGLRSARAAVAQEEGVDASRLVLTASTSEAYALLFKTLCDPGDVVLAPRPSYPLFDHLAALEGVRLVHYPLVAADGWRVDAAAVAAQLAAEPRARAVLLVSPQNPTGAYLRADELAALAPLCAGHDVALVADEVFERYPSSDAPAPGRITRLALADAPCLTFSLGGLSKACGLPQLKLGWIAAGGPPALADAALARLELVADAYLSVATPVQLALPALYRVGADVRARLLARVRANRATLAAAVAASPALTLLPADAGWSALLRYPSIRSDEALALAALDRGVLVHPGHFFDLDDAGCVLVVSLLPDPSVFAPAAAVLAALF
jgi:aspartate/methionine/tyrosine aminotransferase